MFLPPNCTAVISRVIDGDTYIADWNGKQFVVRIAGADCYETRYTQKLRNQSVAKNISLAEAIQRGRAARNFAEGVLLMQVVRLERPASSPDNDAYGRYLREVHTDWGGTEKNVAELLVAHNHVA